MARRTSSWTLPLLLAATAAAHTAASADSMRFEAELCASAHRHNTGGGAIVERTCGTASNGFVMGGLDVDGDYIEFELQVDQDFCFQDSMRADAAPGSPWQFRLEIVPASGGDPIHEQIYPEAIGNGIT
jgi:hypothetical protein